MQKLLEINNISKTFNTLNGEINAIKSISFDVNNEDFIAIVGSSGCGKSTLLNIISGLLEKTNGTIKFYKENPIIGYMLQEDALLPYLNILDNATLGLSLKKIKTKEDIKAKFEQITREQTTDKATNEKIQEVLYCMSME